MHTASKIHILSKIPIRYKSNIFVVHFKGQNQGIKNFCGDVLFTDLVGFFNVFGQELDF